MNSPYYFGPPVLGDPVYIFFFLINTYLSTMTENILDIRKAYSKTFAGYSESISLTQ
jgi:hypothetical protein